MDEKEAREIKPCPFCGAPAKGKIWARCTGEGCAMEQYQVKTIEEWNSAFCWKERDQWRSMAERLADFTEHEGGCIRLRCEAGEPTPDGGYRNKYAGKWYQARPVDETPKCACGYDKALAAFREMKEEKK